MPLTDCLDLFMLRSMLNISYLHKLGTSSVRGTLLLRLNTDIAVLMWQESTLVEGCDPNTVPDKALQEKEKTLLEKYKLVLQAFLHEQTDLQVMAVYSLQVYCYSVQFPKGNVKGKVVRLPSFILTFIVAGWVFTLVHSLCKT